MTELSADRINRLAMNVCEKIYGVYEINWPDGLCGSIEIAIASALDEARLEAGLQILRDRGAQD